MAARRGWAYSVRQRRPGGSGRLVDGHTWFDGLFISRRVCGTEFLHPFRPEKRKPFREGRHPLVLVSKSEYPDEYSTDFGVGQSYDFLTELEDAQGHIVWEHANHMFTKPDGYVIHTYLNKPDPPQGDQERLYCVTPAQREKVNLTLLP